MIVVGMISGTSMDGLDVAVADLTLGGGTLVLEPLHVTSSPWPAELHERLLAALPPAPTTAAEICALDTLVGQAAGRAAAAALAATGRDGDLVSWLGQTIYHWISDGHARGGLQLGQPAWIVEETGLPVVSDLRSRDIAAGGHGAPLAGTLDALWLAGPGGPRAALNLGGIANITVVGGDGILAYDTGPANCLLDVVAGRASGGALHYDAGGALAASGTVDESLLARLLDEPYYAAPPPKSTGRELFTAGYLDALDRGTAPADLAATLVALTARTVADACAAHGVTEVVGSGGGMDNPVLVDALRRALAPVPLRRSDDLGLPSDGKEALLTVLLGALTWHGVPGVVPGATGSAVPRVLGRISPGNAPLRMPDPAGPVHALRLVTRSEAGR